MTTRRLLGGSENATAFAVHRLDREITQACLVRNMPLAYAKLQERRALETRAAA